MKQIFCMSLIIGLAACSRSPSANWDKTFVYEHELETGAGGVTGSIEYELLLADQGCTIKIVGLQVEDQLVCTSVASSDAVKINFNSFANGATKNVLNVAPYEVGSTLFSLHRNGDEYVTTWQSLVPDGIESKTGQYFQPVK